jgi:hypothetical protein
MFKKILLTLSLLVVTMKASGDHREDQEPNGIGAATLQSIEQIGTLATAQPAAHPIIGQEEVPVPEEPTMEWLDTQLDLLRDAYQETGSIKSPLFQYLFDLLTTDLIDRRLDLFFGESDLPPSVVLIPLLNTERVALCGDMMRLVGRDNCRKGLQELLLFHYMQHYDLSFELKSFYRAIEPSFEEGHPPSFVSNAIFRELVFAYIQRFLDSDAVVRRRREELAKSRPGKLCFLLKPRECLSGAVVLKEGIRNKISRYMIIGDLSIPELVVEQSATANVAPNSRHYTIDGEPMRCIAWTSKNVAAFWPQATQLQGEEQITIVDLTDIMP